MNFTSRQLKLSLAAATACAVAALAGGQTPTPAASAATPAVPPGAALGGTVSAVAGSGAAASAPAAALPARPRYVMPQRGAVFGSTIVQWKSLVGESDGLGQQWHVCDNPTATIEKFECHVSSLLPGRISHQPHQHPQEELVLLREGTLKADINGAYQTVGPGSLMFFASLDWHNVENVGTIPAVYFVFNVQTNATASVPPQGAAAAAIPGKLASSAFDWDKFAAKPTKTGFIRQVANAPTMTCENFDFHVITLNPGATDEEPTRHPDEEVFVVDEGTLEVTINGKAEKCGPKTFVFVASNDEHTMKNIGTTPATYHVLRIVTDKTPKPAGPMTPPAPAPKVASAP